MRVNYVHYTRAEKRRRNPSTNGRSARNTRGVARVRFHEINFTKGAVRQSEWSFHDTNSNVDDRKSKDKIYLEKIRGLAEDLRREIGW